MKNIINNGIFAIGNNNTNIMNHVNYQALLEELYILKKASNCDIDSLIEACKEQKYEKLKKD